MCVSEHIFEKNKYSEAHEIFKLPFFIYFILGVDWRLCNVDMTFYLIFPSLWFEGWLGFAQCPILTLKKLKWLSGSPNELPMTEKISEESLMVQFLVVFTSTSLSWSLLLLVQNIHAYYNRKIQVSKTIFHSIWLSLNYTIYNVNWKQHTLWKIIDCHSIYFFLWIGFTLIKI